MFRKRIEKTVKTKDSNVVLALDLPFEKPENRFVLLDKAKQILEEVSTYICAVKFNHHLVLPLGTFDGVKEIIKKAHEMELLTIMDCKLNDIGSTNEVIAEYYYAAGFDALIANPFVGWKDGLESVFRIAHSLKRGVILLTYMSHEGTIEGYGQDIYDQEVNERIPQYVSFAKKALKWKADGVVVGATHPEKIKEVYNITNEKIPIYSPGIGIQGGKIKPALEAGSYFLIVGRAITLAKNPGSIAKKIIMRIRSIRKEF